MRARLAPALLLVGLLAAGCQEKPAPVNLFTGTSDVRVVDARFVTSNDAAAGTLGGMARSYLIMKVHLTNDISEQLYVTPSHFVFTTQDGNRYMGIDSGSSALIGISNDYGALKRGDERDFVVAFRLPIEQAGTISYEY